MRFPAQAVQLMTRMYAMFPDLVHGDEAERRTLIKFCGEQLAFTLDPRWGNKVRAGAPLTLRSKDAIAFLEDDGTCSVWDTQDGTTRALRVVADSEPDYPHLPVLEATFVPCDPIDHLLLPAPTPPPAPRPRPDPGPDEDPDPELPQRLKALEETVAQLAQTVRLLGWEMERRFGLVVEKPLPRYVGSVRLFGYRLTIISVPEGSG